ncbi:MAG: SRPBCC family protein [Chloroflexota bacterium]|nr:SRPBCC family protein [Chloroflexota bacterium]
MIFNLDMISTTLIRATPEHVWDTFSNPMAWPEWSSVCLSVWGLSEPLWNIGSHIGFRLRIAGMGVPFYVEIIEATPPRKISWISTKFSITAIRTFTFQQQNGSTLVTDHKNFRSPILPVYLFYPRRIIRTMTETWLRDLKAATEGNTSTP